VKHPSAASRLPRHARSLELQDRSLALRLVKGEEDNRVFSLQLTRPGPRFCAQRAHRLPFAASAGKLHRAFEQVAVQVTVGARCPRAAKEATRQRHTHSGTPSAACSVTVTATAGAQTAATTIFVVVVYVPGGGVPVHTCCTICQAPFACLL
jgi:hypothetical protein